MQTTLLDYFNWLRDFFVLRVEKKNTPGGYEILKTIPLPTQNTTEHIAFEKTINENKLSEFEQLILLLSLTPYYIPDFLIAVSKIAKEQHDIELFFNRSLVNQSLYPTIETALFLLAGNDVLLRDELFSVFGNDSKLFKSEILSLPHPPHGEPFSRATLSPTPTTVNMLLSNKLKGPEFSHDFPATILESEYNWEDLVLDKSTHIQLHEIKDWLEYENICQQKGIDIRKFKSGYKCLFHGPPGTGKTMAASLIGKLTGYKVYRIDLSAVVSKYIGETEKNLARIFDRASHGKWILFFDEADALFGKRGETQNAHDRYANQEVSYLLQRFESYEGVSILASNFKNNIDSAFNRRFHSIVSFKKPEANERLKLWNIHLPGEFKYDEGINLQEISQNVKITGSAIYNVLRRSCMKAVINGSMKVQGCDLLDSVKLEFAKENKML